MINIIDKKKCCGCNACGDVCSKGAIIFQTDIEGFWYPQVDPAKCVECGLCEKVCPIININRLKHNDLPKADCYAAENKNISVIFSSTSGGIFSALAEATYRENGYVGGAVFNEDFSVKHIISNNREDLVRLRGSKYIQSDLSGFYKNVQTLLKQGEKVLVCGGPCQMAGLRSFLGKDYDNLLIVDYICRGIGSPKVFHSYLQSFERKYGVKVVQARAKSKEFGWRNLTQKVVFANGKCAYESKEISVWTRNFNRDGLFHRPSCHDCQFKGMPRMADITIADFWGVEGLKLKNIVDKDLGISLVMVNSEKGKRYFEQIKKKINYEEVPFEKVTKGNRSLYESVQQECVDRSAFYIDLDTMNLRDALNKHYPKPDSLPLKLRMRRKLRDIYRISLSIKAYTQLRWKPMCQFIKYNTIKEISQGNIFYPTPHCIIHNEGKIAVKGIFILGSKKIPNSKAETRLWIEKGGVFETTGPVEIGYGSDLQVFENAHLTIGGNSNINSSGIIICGESITLGNESRMGRGVTIRDNNGKHYIDIPGYKTSRPIITEDHVWYGEGATIMQGVKIGQGSIVSAKSVVVSNVPPHTIVSGNPAQVVQEDIRWKF